MESNFVAFLRGINVGGNKKIKMSELKNAFEFSGYTDVKTLLNSGNVIFNSDKSNTIEIEKDLESLIKDYFQMEVSIIVRSISQLESLAASEPFKNIKVTKDTRLYVTFVKEPISVKPKIPFEVEGFHILSADETAICSMIEINSNKNTTDFMKLLEKEFGKNITTRNWNTIEKILK